MNENYFVSEKADGIRCLLYSTIHEGQTESYLIDRKNEYYFLPFGLPKRDSWLTDTILDGELVIERTSDKETLLLMFFDAICIDGNYIGHKPYTKRIGALRELVVIPYQERLRRNPALAASYPFKMVQKRLELSYNVHRVFESMGKYHHKTDGVIFTSSVAPYRVGTTAKMLKWKPSDENTVDFLVLKPPLRKLTHSPPRSDFHLGVLQSDKTHTDFGELILEKELQEEWKTSPPYGRVIECRYDPHWPNHWRFSRFRDDKTTANHVSVYDSIMQSIEDNVEKQQLTDASPAIKEKWITREKQQ